MSTTQRSGRLVIQAVAHASGSVAVLAAFVAAAACGRCVQAAWSRGDRGRALPVMPAW